MPNLGLIFTGGGQSVGDLVAIAQQAEASGYRALCMAEAWRSAWIPLTAMAVATQTVRLGPYVVNAYGHSPLFTGMSSIDFHDLSGGRLMLGVGGGNKIINEQWQGIAHERVLTKMREYVEILKKMARTPLGAELLYEGKIHNMRWTANADPGPKAFPVYLAAVFPAMMRVAARCADGIAGGATLSANYIRDILKPQAAEAAVQAGRDPIELKWTAVAITAVHDDREAARRHAREVICHLYAPLPHPYYEFTMREHGFSQAADDLLRLMPAGKLEAAIEAIPDDCIDQMTIAGTPEECRARIKTYSGLVDDLLLLNATPPGPDSATESYQGLFTLPG
ncbi:MAG: LLM class flavin-dependent oxidoreductase [Pseudomonadota bacterium]